MLSEIHHGERIVSAPEPHSPLVAHRVDEDRSWSSRRGCTGTLVLFDQREQAPPIGERCSRGKTEHGGRRITVLRP